MIGPISKLNWKLIQTSHACQAAKWRVKHVSLSLSFFPFEGYKFRPAILLAQTQFCGQILLIGGIRTRERIKKGFDRTECRYLTVKSVGCRFLYSAGRGKQRHPKRKKERGNDPPDPLESLAFRKVKKPFYFTVAAPSRRTPHVVRLLFIGN